MASRKKRSGGKDMKIRWLLGLGLDGKDGHVRVTRGRNFSLLGGSRDTHDAMQEKAIKLNEELDRRQTTLDRLSRGEFMDIAGKIGLCGDKPQADNPKSAD